MEDLERAHRHSLANREEIEASEKCGCFYCLASFPPREVANYIRDHKGQTALCPRCHIDAVLGDRSGCPIERDFLEKMHQRWFGDGR